jgi:hypothetical protein
VVSVASRRAVMPMVRAFAAAGALAGCGNPVEDGTFRGDVELRLRGVLVAPVLEDTSHPLVGVVWLGYDALVDRHGPAETSTLPISAFSIGHFTFDVIDRPPGVGNYLSAQGQVIPWPIRLGRLVVLDDHDADGAFSVGADGRVTAPDRVLVVCADSLLLYAGERPSTALDGTLLTAWRDARAGYQLIHLQAEAPPPDVLGRVVVTDDPVVFVLPGPTVTE